MTADGDIYLIVARGTIAASDPFVRVEGSTVDEVLDMLDVVPENARVVAAIDSAANDRDEFVALVSVLAVRGVAAFETSHPQAVRRILDTHSAIVAGEIEVLEA